MRLLLISGSTRQNSTNGAALEDVRRNAPPGSSAHLYGGLSALPAFNPDQDHGSPPALVGELRAAIGAADAVVISTPEYAGTLPGSLKNLLDWTVGGTELTDKPVAWINVAGAGRGRGAVSTLETVLGYVGASVVTDACITETVAREALGSDGKLTDRSVSTELNRVWAALSAALDACEGRGADA
jgi:NAD(P)H-dependent FMN reductase